MISKDLKLSSEILDNAGWEYLSGLYVLKTPIVRISWNPRTSQLYVGYGLWPVKCEYVWHLQNILKDCELFDCADNLEKSNIFEV